MCSSETFAVVNFSNQLLMTRFFITIDESFEFYVGEFRIVGIIFLLHLPLYEKGFYSSSAAFFNSCWHL